MNSTNQGISRHFEAEEEKNSLNLFHSGQFVKCYHLQKLNMLYQSYTRSRRHLLVSLYQYNSEKIYKKDGFATFSEAYAFLKQGCGIDLQIDTLRKYFSLINHYKKAGWEPFEILQYPLSRLARLKSYSDRINQFQLTHLLRCDKEAFDAGIKKLIMKEE